MKNLSIHVVGSAYTDVLRRLSRQWAGRAVPKALVLKAATSFGTIGRMAVVGDNREHVAGFLIGTVEGDDTIQVSWLVAHPDHRLPVLQTLLNSVSKEFPGFDLVIRIQNDEATKYEFLADLRDASWADVTPDSSRPIKVTDERASYVYVRLRGQEALGRGGRHDGPPAVGKHPR
jgi:hypothetical protein